MRTQSGIRAGGKRVAPQDIDFVVMHPDPVREYAGRDLGSVPRRAVLRTVAAAGAIWLSGSLRAQDRWPSRPIRIICGQPPGGLTDQFARAYGDALARALGQPVLVDNRPGASGTIAVAAAAKAAPDGHTLLVSTVTALWHSRVLYRNLPFDADRDIAPVAMFPAGALLMAVNAALPIRTPREYIAHARARGGSMGTYSPASLPHMIADQWNRQHDLKIQAIHYKGESPMWVDVSTGQIDAGVGSFQALAPYLQRGTVRPVAALGPRRSPRVPEVPTFAELGHAEPVFVLDGWVPLCVPSGTPEDIQARLAEAVVAAFREPKLQALHQSFGIPNAPIGLQDSRKRWKEDAPEWIALAERTGVKLE